MAEIEPPAGEPRYFSIIVVGAMTPPQHFPYWYSLSGLLTQEEATEGMLSGELIVTPEYARFKTAGMRIVCERDRWEISCFDNQTRPRILAIACGVFAKLMEVPVTGYGFNSFADLDTKASPVRDALTKLAIATELGFEFKGLNNCQFDFKDVQPENNRSAQVIIRPSDRDTAIWVAFNNSHTIDQSVPKIFDLTPELTEHFAKHWEEAKKIGHRVVGRINEIAGVLNGNT